MNILLSTLLVALTVGCSSVSDAEHKADDNGAPNKIKIIEIARRAVEANDSWANQAEFEEPKKNTDGSWSVLVWRIPKTPGGHRLIAIDQEGKVTSYMRGK